MMGVQRSSPVLPQREMASSSVSVDEEPSPTEWLFLWKLPRKGQGLRAQIFELLSEFGDVKKAKKISALPYAFMFIVSVNLAALCRW